MTSREPATNDARSTGHQQSTATETELKIPVDDLSRIRSSLERNGAELVKASLRETNVLLDTPRRTLRDEGRVLRIRRYGEQWVLTHKGAARYSGQIKHREELELEVADGEMLALILDRLGLQTTVRYEKEREIWRLAADPSGASSESIEICLDHTPMGDFVELEGPSHSLEPACRQLGLSPDEAVRGSYVSLWESYRTGHPEAPRFMVFEP